MPRSRGRGLMRGGRGARSESRAESPPSSPPSGAVLRLRTVEEVVGGHGLEVPLHMSRERRWPNFVAPPIHSSSALPDPTAPALATDEPMATSPSPPPSSSAPLPAASPAQFVELSSQGGLPSPRAPPRRYLRNLEEKDFTDLLNYGSDPSSEESGDEEGATLGPRVALALMDTPLDHQPDAGDYFAEPVSNDEPDFNAEPVVDSDGEDAPLMATDQPRRWYDFEWKEFPTTPFPPELRREPFSQINVGPTTPREDPYDIFVAIWDRPIMEYIASETNKYAQWVANQMLATNNLHPNSRISRWKDTSADELLCLFSMILAMGVVVKSRLDEYWSVTTDVVCTPNFSAYMSIDRFQLLCKCLHFSDNDGMYALNLEVSEARLYKIKPILSHLNRKFQEMYTPSQNIALDESLLMWKGWLEIGQLIPNKAARKGIKTYEICESQTGYLWRFEVHSQKKSAPQAQQFQDPLEAPVPSIVLRLVQGLEHKGYTLWMDNFYNSPCLARRLKSLGFDCVGTLRTDRQFVPQALHNLTKQNMETGALSGLTSGDIDIVVWKDKNRVATISTYHGIESQTRQGSTKPIVIWDYNIMMGGVDKKDQILSMFPVERKRHMVWYKKLFRRLLNVSVLNSFVIHCQSSPSSALSYRNFRMQLIRSILSRHTSRPIPIPIATAQDVQYDVSAHNPPFYASMHRIDEYDMNTTCKPPRRVRRHCVVCKRLVSTYCVGCNKTLCMRNCFLSLHP